MSKPLFSFFVVLVIQFGTSFSAPEVQLPNGVIRGREDTTINGKSYFAFEKIPYAAPPVGELRFKPPVPPQNWEEPLDTLNLDVECYQVGGNSGAESEDCLYINVFTPLISNGSLPTILYIHGGGFIGGSGRNTYSDYFIEEDVIFATINYRLGPFGFLSTGDDIFPGNNGLKDQQMALKWAHDNIYLFGGDPDKITIMGQSAGSASCAYHLLNQQSKGLFRSAILESGSFLSPFAFQRRAKEIAFDTAAFINDSILTHEDPKVLYKFLKDLDAKEIDLASEKYHYSETLEWTQVLTGRYYSPVVEVKNPSAFLTKKMYGLLKAGNVVKVPILIGINSEEGLVYNSNAEIFQNNMATYDANLAWLVPKDMMLIDDAPLAEMGAKIRTIYVGSGNLSANLGDAIRYFSDQAFTRSIIKTAELYSNFSDTFFYQFSYDGKLGGVDIHYDGAENVGHAEELHYLFCRNSGCNLDDNPESDRVTRQRLIKLWTNFAKYQNPTPEVSELLQNVTWPKVSTENGDFLYLDINENLEIKNHPKEATFGKWVELYDGLGYDNFDTY